MSSLSSTQLSDLQSDLAIGSDESVFTNDELDRLYTRAEGDYNQTVVLALRQLLMNFAKLNDYQLVHSSEKKSQIFTQVKTMLKYWEEEVVQGPNQVSIVGMAHVPPTERDTPNA